MQTLKNNEVRQKFTGSDKKKSRIFETDAITDAGARLQTLLQIETSVNNLKLRTLIRTGLIFGLRLNVLKCFEDFSLKCS